MSDADANFARIARVLAEHLLRYQYARHETDRKAIAVLQAELCYTFKMELLEQQQQKSRKSDG